MIDKPDGESYLGRTLTEGLDRVSEAHSWQDATAIGSIYEQQINMQTGRFRHRRRLLLPESDVQQHPDDGWRSGPAPG